MKLLYSDILPLAAEDGQQTIADCFKEQLTKADRLEIAVGYVSRASLEELDELAAKCNIGTVCLNIGMYYIEGMPESSYHTAVKINRKWADAGIGEIRMVRAFKYHGKIYCFYKDSKPFAAIIGSANLGVLKLEASNRRQYELASLTTDADECREIAEFLNKLKQPSCSAKISDISDMPLIFEKNNALSGIELVTEVPPTNVEFYRRCAAYASFMLPLKVPATAERHMDDGRHFTKSNINVCYAAPRSRRKSRDWYETQLTVAKEITHIDGYPQKNVPFFIVTDDGYWFKAHTTSDGNKQFSAVGDELIMGRWLKGRLVAAGLVAPINDTQKDTDRKGMITKEILQEYGCENLYLKKTGQTALDEEGNELDVWMLSFKPEDMEGDAD
ncbi:MAG: NgoFVII family restriction endonuclease [Eubacterium sp.]|nr:NgoFVII family restriction endonuclease [Eubacterium sp.]